MMIVDLCSIVLQGIGKTLQDAIWKAQCLALKSLKKIDKWKAARSLKPFKEADIVDFWDSFKYNTKPDGCSFSSGQFIAVM